jgi:hypothetical protein
VTSTIVEATGSPHSPASRYTSISQPSCARACSAVVAGGSPEMFALDTAMGPVALSTSSATGCSGIRTATVPLVSPRSQASDGACSTTSVSPPGQNASTSCRTVGRTDVTSPSMVCHDPTSTGTGMSRPRRLAESSVWTAVGENASAPSPYTVSVGRTTRSPRRTASIAAAIPCSRSAWSRQS